MQTSYFLMILVFTITTLGIIIQLPIASSDDFGGMTQLYAPRPDLTRISLSLNDTFHQTSQNSTKDLHFRFFDANNNSTINNVTFFINATKDGKVLMHDLFYTSTGSITLKFSPDNDIEKWVVHGTNEPTLGGWMSKNDTLHITGSVFTEGTYHIHVEVLSLFYVNELVDQSNPPKFDSWWSVDDKGNISKYDNSVISFGSTTPSVKIKDESPIKQFKSGVLPQDVKCKEGFVLIIKVNGEPTCVKPTNVSRLLTHGWLTLEKFEIIHQIVQQNATNSLDQNHNATDQSAINYTQSSVISNPTYKNPLDITYVINNLDSLSGKRITVSGYWYDVYPFPHTLPACRAIDPNVKPIYDNSTYAPNVFGGNNYLTNTTNWKGGEALVVTLPNNANLESPVIDRGKFVTVTGVLEKYYQINCWGDRYYKSAYLQVNPNQNNTNNLGIGIINPKISPTKISSLPTPH